MSPSRFLKRQSKVRNLRSRFTGNPQANTAIAPATAVNPQVSTLNPIPAAVVPIVPFVNTMTPATTTVNPSHGNRTFFNDSPPPPSPSPSTSVGSYRPWPGGANIDPRLRTLGGLPYDIPGDNGESYRPPFSDSSSASSRSRTASPTQAPRPPPTPSSSCSNASVISTNPSSSSCCCCGLGSLLCKKAKTRYYALKTSTHNLLTNLTRPHVPPSPPFPTHTHSTAAVTQRLLSHSIDYELVMIHHTSLAMTTAEEFLEWFFGFYDVRGRGVGRLRRGQVGGVSGVMGELEGGGLWVVGDAERGEVAGEVAAVLRRLRA